MVRCTDTEMTGYEAKTWMYFLRNGKLGMPCRATRRSTRVRRGQTERVEAWECGQEPFLLFLLEGRGKAR